jgi:SAM-dependent methyltransferase
MDLTDAPLPERPIDVTRAEILTRLLGQFTPGTALDLACGTGWFSRIAAGLGWQVTGIDARRRPAWDDPEPGVQWHEQDVRDVDTSGYDLIMCLGIFYHLEFTDQMTLLRKCGGTPMILDTHVGLTGAAEPAAGYTGQWYQEGAGLLASWGNPRSFWPTTATLRTMLTENGYATAEPVEPWYHGADRTFWTCLPA